MIITISSGVIHTETVSLAFGPLTEQGTNAFGNGAVSAFGDASLLVGVMDTELVLSSFRFAMRNKIFPQVFSTMVDVEDFNAPSELGFYPSFKAFVGLEGFAFLSEQVQECKLSFVVCKGDPITLATFRLDWRLSPEIRMDLISKLFGSITFLLLWNRFSGRFRIHARLAEEVFDVRGVTKLDTEDMLVLDKFASGLYGDMTHTTVELFRREYFFSYHDLLPFMNDFVKMFRSFRDRANMISIRINDDTTSTTDGHKKSGFVKLPYQYQRVFKIRGIEYILQT